MALFHYRKTMWHCLSLCHCEYQNRWISSPIEFRKVGQTSDQGYIREGDLRKCDGMFGWCWLTMAGQPEPNKSMRNMVSMNWESQSMPDQCHLRAFRWVTVGRVIYWMIGSILIGHTSSVSRLDNWFDWSILDILNLFWSRSRPMVGIDRQQFHWATGDESWELQGRWAANPRTIAQSSHGDGSDPSKRFKRLAGLSHWTMENKDVSEREDHRVWTRSQYWRESLNIEREDWNFIRLK
jgi:hypothetical protein